MDRPGDRQGASVSGVAAAALGASLGTLVSMAVALPLAHWSSDAENGWFHDPQGWLLLVAIAAVWTTAAAGTGAAIAAVRQPMAGRTAAWMVAAMPLVGLAFVVLSVPGPLWWAAPAVAGATARLLTRPPGQSSAARAEPDPG